MLASLTLALIAGVYLGFAFSDGRLSKCSPGGLPAAGEQDRQQAKKSRGEYFPRNRLPRKNVYEPGDFTADRRNLQ